jgi:hypothetical protein
MLKDLIKSKKKKIELLVELLKEKLDKKSKKPQRWVLRFTNSQGFAKESLLNLLTEIGLFQFYSKNNSKLLNVSQVVYYLKSGWKALENGYTAGKSSEVEIHHIDGDITNDSPHNLVALFSGDHYYVSACQNGTFRLEDFFWQNSKATDQPTLFNNQGRPIKNHAKFLQRIIAATLFNTQRWLEKAAMRTGAKVKQIVGWVVKKLGQAVEKGVQAIKAIAVKPQENQLGSPLLNSPKTTWRELRRAILKPVIV